LQFLPSSHPSISALSAVNAMPLGSCRRGIVIDTACANGPNVAAPIRVQKEAPAPPKLLDRVRQAVRMRHYSRRTEEAYTAWIRRYILFHKNRHPREMGAAEVSAFLADLAVRQRVSASTQNQALSGLLFLYREVLRTPLPRVEVAGRGKMPTRLPVVLSRDEVGAVLRQLPGTIDSLRRVAAVRHGSARPTPRRFVA